MSPCSTHTRRNFGPSSSPYYPHLLRNLNVTMTLPTMPPKHRNPHHAKRIDRHWRAEFGDSLRSGEGQREPFDLANNPHGRAVFSGDFPRSAHDHEHAQAHDTRTHTLTNTHTNTYTHTHTHTHTHSRTLHTHMHTHTHNAADTTPREQKSGHQSPLGAIIGLHRRGLVQSPSDF